MSGQDYEKPWLAGFFNSFPHLDLTFQQYNSTFNPDSARYKESLAFWAAIPVLWLLLTLVIFLIYFCYRCFQRDVEKKRQVPCLKWSLAILALLTCAAIGAGFYGNEEANKGLVQFSKAGEDAHTTITYMKKQVHELQENINKTVQHGLKRLLLIFSDHGSLNRNMKDQLSRGTQKSSDESNKILKNVRLIQLKAEKVDLSRAVELVKEYGYFRWVGIIMLLCWQTLLCLLLLLGIGRSSKCMLLMFCAFGIFTLVLCWMSAGLHLGLSVGVGDFCVSPHVFFEKIASESIEKEYIKYYLRCNQPGVTNPFSSALKDAVDSVTTANSSLTRALNLASKVLIYDKELKPTSTSIYDGLQRTVGHLQQLTALVECTNIHKDYIDGVEGVCHTALPGFVFLLLSATVTGLLFTTLVLLASCAWRHFGRYKKNQYVERKDSPNGYQGVADDETFLPNADSTSPSYYSFTRGRHGNPHEALAMQQKRRGSPPPAYNSMEYHSQFSDTSQTLSEMRDMAQESIA